MEESVIVVVAAQEQGSLRNSLLQRVLCPWLQACLVPKVYARLCFSRLKRCNTKTIRCCEGSRRWLF